MEQSARRKLLNTVFEIKENRQRSSLSPSGSTKSLKLRMETLSSEQSINTSISSTPRTYLQAHTEASKPISLIIIEKYFSDICQCIAAKGQIEPSLLSKASTMQDVLKDCLSVIHDLSLQFYVLMASALKEIQQIELTQDQSLYSTLAKKLLQLAELIEDNKYTSQTERVVTLPNDDVPEVTSLAGLGKELFVRINRVTVRVLNIWKKILNPQREAAVISCGFLLLYCEVDPALKISPNSRIPIDKAIVTMKNYLANPGHVVTIIRRSKEFVDKEMISVETFQRIKELIGKVTLEQVRNADKTLTGFAIYELVLFVVRYFEAYAFEHYKLRVFDMAEVGCRSPISPLDVKDLPQSSSRASIDQPNPRISIQAKSRVQLNQSTRKSMSNSSSSPLASLKQTSKYSPKPNSSPLSQVPKSIEKNSALSLKPHSASPSKNKMQVFQSKPLQAQTKPALFTNKPSASPTKPGTSNLKLNQPQSTPRSAVHSEDYSIKVTQKPLDKSLLAAKQIITTSCKSQSNRTTPVRNRTPSDSSNDCVRTRDLLEEMQYQQFIEEKFRHFLVDKLKAEGDKLLSSGQDRGETRIAIELKATRAKADWIQEFEQGAGIIRFNACKKLADDKRYTAELIRAQRQLDILERYQ